MVQKRTRQVIVAMNNIGVSLLERGLIKAAAATLQDTLVLIKAACVNEGVGNSSEESLKNAFHYLIHATNFSQPDIASNPSIVILSHGDLDRQDVARRFHDYERHTTSCFAIRLDEIRWDEDFEDFEDTYESETAVVLMNCAVAQYVRAFHSQDSAKKERLLRISMSILNQSFELLINLIEGLDDCFQISQILPCAMVVVKNQMEFKAMENTRAEVQESFRLRLSRLRDIYSRLDLMGADFPMLGKGGAA